jgi:hypothetical protein
MNRDTILLISRLTAAIVGAAVANLLTRYFLRVPPGSGTSLKVRMERIR